MSESKAAYPVRSVLLALETGAPAETVSKILASLDVTKVTVRDSGTGAWQAILAFPYDMVIMGWRLPGVNGLALFNRVRQIQHYQTVPMIVCSQAVKSEEFALLSEFPCSRLATEQLTKGYLTGIYRDVIDEAGWYRTNAALIESLIDFAEKNASKAIGLLKGPLAKAPNPAPLAMLMARKLRDNGFYAEAESVIRDHLLKFPDGPVAYAELGKILYMQHRYKEAQDVLERAHMASPKNMARLCLLGEIDLTLANPSGALSRFARVLEIDAESPTGKVGVQIVKAGNANAVGRQMSVPRSLASMLNIAAIGNVRRKNYDEAIEGYTAALNLASEREARFKLCFNLGLGFLRWGKLDKSVEWFRVSCEMADGAFEKANRFLALAEQKVRDQASLDGTTTTLSGGDDDEEISLFG